MLLEQSNLHDPRGSSLAASVPTWSPQVFVNVLQRVDMRATVGQQSSTTLAISGGSSDRLVAAYSSQPGELQATPATLSLPAGGIAALGLVFKPRSWGHQRVRACTAPHTNMPDWLDEEVHRMASVLMPRLLATATASAELGSTAMANVCSAGTSCTSAAN
jgi:hypothetical protein